MENTFFKMLITLLDSKKVNGSKNVDFNFKEILNMLSPKKVMDDIKQLRKEIAYLHENMSLWKKKIQQSLNMQIN